MTEAGIPAWRAHQETNMNSLTFDSPIGLLTLIGTGEALTSICFDTPGYPFNPSPLLLKALSELREYFAGERREFDIPLAPEGTEFQQKVWKALEEIPYGETRSYGEIAQEVGSPRAARAVGLANNKNPIPIMLHARDLDAGDSRAGKRRQEDSAQRVTKRCAVAALERLDYILAV